jgi:hypothetical protein
MFQCGSASRLTLLGTIPGSGVLEAEIHERFYDKRRHGEWFALSDADVDTVLKGGS